MRSKHLVGADILGNDDAVALVEAVVRQVQLLQNSVFLEHACGGLRVNNYFTEMCSGSEVGSYLRFTDFVYHSTLGLRVITKKKKNECVSTRWTRDVSGLRISTGNVTKIGSEIS